MWKKPSRASPGLFLDTSKVKDTVKFPQLSQRGSRSSLYNDDKKQLVNVPPFVQLESLHAGKVFVSEGGFFHVLYSATSASIHNNR